MSAEPVDAQVESGVLWITLNRPDVLNALDVATHLALRAALRRAAADDVGAVVLTGAGRGFCVGQDLEEFRNLVGDASEHLRRYYNPNIVALRELGRPVIAAVNGVTAGAGIGLACACDLRLCSDQARFTPAFASMALVPDSGTSYFVPRLMGGGAFAWLTSGTSLEAAEAQARGLVDEVVPAPELRARAAEVAGAYARQPRAAVAMSKRLLRSQEAVALERQLELEAQLQRVAAASEAHRQALAAFLSRRRG